jgi:hypothetical protein
VFEISGRVRVDFALSSASPVVILARAIGKKPVADNPLALQSALDDLAAFLAHHPNKRPHTASDPTKLPWDSPKGDVRAPIETVLGYKLSGLFPQDVVKLAQAGSLTGITLPTPAGPTLTAADLAGRRARRTSEPGTDVKGNRIFPGTVNQISPPGVD